MFLMIYSNKKITVCGSFGYGNAGDEAIPLAINHILQTSGINDNVDVLSRFKTPDIPAVIGTDDAVRLERIKGQPIVAAGGGIIEPGERATVLRCKTFLSKSFASDIAFVGVSVEPGVKYGWFKKNEILKILRQSTLPEIYTRDVVSESTLRKLYPKLSIKTVGDLVLWLPSSDKKPEDFSIKNIEQRYIAVSLSGCWADDAEWYKWIVTELINLTKEINANLVFVPMSSKFDDDRNEHKKVAALLAQQPDFDKTIVCLDGDYSATDVAAVYQDAIIVVSTRLHGCVIAYAQKTPFVGISYHPKLIGFSYTVGLRKFILPIIVPRQQFPGIYGFRFKDLNLQKNTLVNAGISAIVKNDFSALEYYKRESLSAMQLFLSSIEIR